ncbi:antA/AntB antirepressor family protein, partial [Paraburkholderia sp. SARCC-3016]|uniref:antA/AntB antirepressor family protein n=1 Tax=Paraburkholderia sp. SARCC-3016 TaxID=3058611 RepID=UPI002807C133
MGNDLLKISETQIAGAVVETSDARELHEKLNVARDFNLWIAEQIKRARLVADRDYLTYENVVQMPSGAKRRKECALTLDAAKHVAMMSGSERGFEIREFFIDREKTLAAIERAKSRIALPDFTDPVAAARAWADAKESEQKAVALANEQAGQLEAQKPAVEFVERYVKEVGGQAVLGRQNILPTPWLTERHG